jgi:branched-chain amino acid transport system permease protein
MLNTLLPLGLSVAAVLLLITVKGPLAALALGSMLACAIFMPLSPTVRMLLLVGTTLGACMGIRLERTNDFFFITLVMTLVSAITLKTPLWFKSALGAAILLVGMFIFGFANSFYFELALQIAIYSAMALGLNVVVGQAGLLDLGYAAFFAIGAYTWAIFGSSQANNFIAGNHFPLDGWWFYIFMVIAIFTTAVTGLIVGLPALRLRGDYLAIVTLGLGEVVRVVANNLNQPINITNGALGITPVGQPPLGWFGDLLTSAGVNPQSHHQIFFYLLALVLIGLIVLVNVNLNNSRFGRAWVAIREDEIAAKAMGIPMLQTKLIAFATGAAFSGAMGVVWASSRTFVSPESFTLLASIAILGYVVLGGMGSINGVILGTAALIILNLDILKNASAFLNQLRTQGILNIPSQLEPTKYERLVFGLILVLMMIFRPQGLIPEKRHRLEEEAREAK